MTRVPAARNSRASDRLAPPPRPKRDFALEKAISEERIAILYQPQVDPATGALVGAEALARWEETSCSDDLFARAARAGLTERLSRHVQKRVIYRAAQFSGALKDIGISINCAAEDLVRKGYADWLLDQIQAAWLDPERLTLEITESSLVRNRDKVSRRLAKLRSAGISIALDDFGTGYAALDYLTTLPLDSLKIDRGLLIDLVTGERDQIVVRSMMKMASELGLKVVVEGVETEEQLALVREWGCDLVQGFLVSEGVPEARLALFAEKRAA